MDEITFTGKKGKPFPIRRHSGTYFFISETDFKKLKQINEACKDEGIKHLKEISIVGRGGVLGTKPFLRRAPEGGFLDDLYLYILSEHAVEFDEVRKGYDELTREAEVKKGAEEEKVVVKGQDGKYVYCVICADCKRKDFGNSRIPDTGEVYALSYKEFAAVVSDSPMKEYEAHDENIKAHEEVVRKILDKGDTVLPVAFNMVFKDKRTLLITMSKARKALRKAYETVDGKVELGIKAILTKEAIKNKSEELAKNFESDLLKALDGKFTSLKQLGLFSDRLALNMAFLVDRDKIEDFSEAIEFMNTRYGSLKIQYSGPWAPYNFVDIRILGKGGGN